MLSNVRLFTPALALLQPNAPAAILQTKGHVFDEELLVELLQECIEANDPEFRVVLEECSQHVKFVPRPPFIHPFFGILERVEDVMKMDVHTPREDRQHVKERAIYVAACLTDVGRVDK
jgi:hypothetical protein